MLKLQKEIKFRCWIERKANIFITAPGLNMSFELIITMSNHFSMRISSCKKNYLKCSVYEALYEIPHIILETGTQPTVKLTANVKNH